ncbi:MAG TPA: flagellar motor switch protein FliN [Planctomycetes bacterium]|nr:flagellar motor switch protein FliN [Planctomycetota bacterium]
MSEDTPQEVEQDVDLEQAIDEATEAVSVQAARLHEIAGDNADGEEMELGHLLDVPVAVTVEMGQTRMTLGELVRLGPGSLVSLDREAHEPADILVNGKTVARGEVVTIGKNYGIRITQVEG